MKQSRHGKNGRRDYHNPERSAFLANRRNNSGMTKPLYARSGKDNVMTFLGGILLKLFNFRRFKSLKGVN